MGGYGSGRWGVGHVRRLTVEECLALSAAKMQSLHLLRGGILGEGTLTWTQVSTGEKISTIGFKVNTLALEAPSLCLHYTITQSGDVVCQPVSLTTTRLPWGGVRWWFVCPLAINGERCGRRVGKLYLPPGGRYFGCRHCYDLTYTSCRESHRFDTLFRMLEADTGIPAATVKHMLTT